jgi:hypothetical protein
MDYFTKWLEVYTIPNQEASTVADALVRLLLPLRGPKRAAQRSRLELQVSTPAGVAALGDKQVIDHSLSPTVRWYGRMICEDS